MNNVITALGNPILNIELKKNKDINVLLNDLQYKEAILEFLDKNIKIDYLVLSDVLPGEIEINELINILKEKNKNIKIILIKDDKKTNIENKNIDYIFFNNEVDISDLLKIIVNKKINENYKIKKELIKKNNNKTNIINNKNIIISILGGAGVGKSIFAIVLANTLENECKKILIIDLDILNNNISTILGVKKYSTKIIDSPSIINYSIENFIIKINKKIDILSGLDLIFTGNKKNEITEILNNIKKLKNKYEYILIDTSSECFFEYNKNVIKMSDLSIFLVEGNLLEIKKSRKLLDIYEKEWKINKEKIKIIINKYNNNSIKKKVLIKLFNEQEIIGKIKMSDFYNEIINKNNKIQINNKNILNEYKKIGKKVLKINFDVNKNNYNKFYKKLIKNLILKKF